MRLRTFTAPDMPTAMNLVREALGEDAVIISTKADKGRVVVTAAVEPEATRGNALPDGAWLESLGSLLRFHNVPEPLSGRLVYKARAQNVKNLEELLTACFRFEPLVPAPRVLLCGPPGVGKTLAAAKLATQCARGGLSPTVITTDLSRAGGVAQLEAFTDILKLPLHVAATPQELRDSCENAAPGALIIDTAGCNPYSANERRELAALVAAQHGEPLLCLPAGMDAHEAMDTARALSQPTTRRLLVTRLDSTRRLGAVLAAAEAKNLAICATTDSASAASVVSPLTPALLARRLLAARGDDG